MCRNLKLRRLCVGRVTFPATCTLWRRCVTVNVVRVLTIVLSMVLLARNLVVLSYFELRANNGVLGVTC